MSKRKTIDKVQARERRNRLLESAAAADLSLTEGVREMRVIAGMTQDEFARHRGVSARVIKAIELGQGNPTVATMNRIAQFFGLEVAFVPIKRDVQLEGEIQAFDFAEPIQKLIEEQEKLAVSISKLDSMFTQLGLEQRKKLDDMASSLPVSAQVKQPGPEDAAAGKARPRTKRKSQAS